MSDDDFESVLARGLEKRRQAEADAERERRRRENEGDGEDARERRRILWWSCSWGGMFKAELGWLYLMLFSMFVLAPLTVVAVMVLRPSNAVGAFLFPGQRKIIPLPTIAAAIALWVWAGTAARRGLARERRWIAALPFTLTGYEDCLGDRPSDNKQYLRLRLGFAGTAPPDQLAIDLLSGDGGSWKVDEKHRSIVRSPGVDPGYRNYEHNRALRRWFHRLVADQLLPLHREHPLISVELGNAH